jgi:TonB family protein
VRKACELFVFVFSLVGPALAANLNLEKQLTDKYKNQVLSLRHPFISQQQVYGFDGEPVSGVHEGPWTLYGRIQIEKVVADRNQLRVKGTRVLCEFTETGLKLLHDKKKVALAVRLSRPLASEEEAIALLGRVFALTPQEIVNSAPDYWQEYLRKNLLGGPGPEKEVRTANPPKDPPPSNPENAGDAKEKIFHVGEIRVTAPKPKYTPEPEFTDAARKERYQGSIGINVIVNPEGRITKPRIVRPLGLGLDENAIEAISKWRFAPGTRDGQPVSVAVYIQVDLHLF